MDYEIVGTSASGTPIKRPIWETMTLEEQAALRAELDEYLAGQRDCIAIDKNGYEWYDDECTDPVLDENGKQVRSEPWAEQS